MKIEKFAKLEKFVSNINEYQHVRHGGIARCTICNCVSNEDIETTIGDYRPGMSFVADPGSSGLICVECQDVIQDQRFDYELLDQEDD